MPRHSRFRLFTLVFTAFLGGCFTRTENAVPESPFHASAESLPIDQVIGSVKTNDQGHVTEVDYRSVATSNDDLKLLRGIKTIKAIKISGKDGKSSVTDEGVAYLSDSVGLKVLALDFLPVTSSGIASLEPLTELRELLLAKTDIRDDALESVVKFQKLTKLRIAGTAITDKGFVKLATLNGLKSLDISECLALTDKSASTISQLTNLQQLNLWRVPITDTGLADIAKLQKLKSLNLDNTLVTDSGLPSLSSMTGLTFLHLGMTDITDDGLVHLETLTELKDLIVTRTGVTADGVAKLQTKLPDTKIQLQYEGDQ